MDQLAIPDASALSKWKGFPLAVTSDSDAPLEKVVVRGAVTRTGIGVVEELAKSKATTYVLWDRRHRAAQEPTVNKALRKPIYADGEEEKPDINVREKARQWQGAEKPRCALLHIVSDKQYLANTMEKPLCQTDELLKACAGNHSENLFCLHAATFYQSFIHETKSAFFVLHPHMMTQYNRDIAAACVSSHRVVLTNPLCLHNGNGTTIGLQLVDSNASQNAKYVHSAMMRLVNASWLEKRCITGRTVTLSSEQMGLYWPAPTAPAVADEEDGEE